MRELPVLLPPIQSRRAPGPWRDAVFFLFAFGAVFLAALILLDGAAATLIA